MMSDEEILTMFADAGAIITDSHIVYTSGKHGSAYMNKDAVYPSTKRISLLCKEMATRFLGWGQSARTVVGPAIGGVILSQWTAHHLSAATDWNLDIASCYAEKDEKGDGFVIKRGYDKLVKNQHTLVVEDIWNTGGSGKKTVDAVRAAGGIVVGVCALCNRGGVTRKDLGVDESVAFFSLIDVALDAWDEADCPLCKANVPVNINVGHGKAYLAGKLQA